MSLKPEFTGADALLETAAAAGVDLCFANPGTTEMPLVAALARQQAIRPVLCVFEGVCSGAADGYGRIAGKPAMTLTHLGPGFANAIANLHNARRGRSPVVNVVGEHATWHLPFDPPLTADIVSLARPVSAYVGTIGTPADASPKTREAIAAARVPPGQVATLIFPADCQQAAAPPEPQGIVLDVPSALLPDPARIASVAARLRESRAPLLLLGGNGLTARGQRAAQRLVIHCNARLVSETFPSTSDRGGGLPSVPRLPYFPEPAMALAAAHDLVVLAGTREPVTFFGYEGMPSVITAPGTTLALARPDEDAAGALEALADALGAPLARDVRVEPPPAPSLDAPLTPENVMAALVPRIPEDAVVVVEGGTLGYPYFAGAAAARRHRAICLSGGSIGFAPPAALGAALANPGRPVFALAGDGAALYTSQALWSMAREGLPVVLCVAANRTYNVVRTELTRAGVPVTGHAASLTSLESPSIDWTSLAKGYGVGGERVRTFQDLGSALDRALASSAPYLIELSI
jgi:acetolactate synthase-1/2/3 large subunit